MLIGSELLLRGERQTGYYQVQIVRQSGQDWTMTFPPLNVLATNYRLIMIPQTRKPYPSASIPASMMVEAGEMMLGPRSGVMLRLKTGHRIYMVVASSQGDRLISNVRRMSLALRRIPIVPAKIARRDLSRMIAYIERL